MSIYAIGDVQGCFAELQDLLAVIHFNPAKDKLWFSGDLVNRGPQSLNVLRYVKSLKTSAICVLGNHDLHLLAVAQGLAATHQYDTLTEILNAPDSQELCDWLRMRPLLHHDNALGFTLVHAGLSPQWDLPLAQQCANELEQILRSPQYLEFLKHMYGDQPKQWSPNLSGWQRARFICNCFTRIRYCTLDGALDFKHKGPIGSQPAHLFPWFTLDNRANKNLNIIFGHWAALGAYREKDVTEKGIYALDSGCVWGNSLTAFRLEDKKWFTVSCKKLK